MITTKELIAKYGKPSETGKPYLTTIALPYKMKLSWDKKVSVSKISCHKLVAEKLTNIFNEILDNYGLAKIQELGIDIYGGCFNYRKMRGGSDYSRHTWGVAIDLDPERNQLKETSKTARFARPEYDKLHEIFEKYGFENMGKVKGYDWMHWQVKN